MDAALVGELEGVATVLARGRVGACARAPAVEVRAIALRVQGHQLVADECRLVVVGVACCCGGIVVTRLSPSFSRQKL
jgi:hypothetical protein